MTILTDKQLATVRRNLARRFDTVNYTKIEVNLALQGIEDWFEANKANLSGAIDTATSPFTFTIVQKKMLIRYWLAAKIDIEESS